ncbi:MAG: single-stranded DNA-binding protein [Chloroflexota bacterium]|nr:single-stranded DNA-binding protein [Chloroflexota bacterium]
MAGLAKVTLVGNLGGDPETRYTPQGTMNVNFSIAVSRRFKDSSGQDQERTTWFRITAWGKLAETIDGLVQRGFVGKGRQVYVDGRIESREWTTNEGEKRTSLDVTANEFQMLGNRPDGQGESGGGGYSGGGNTNTGGGGRRESFDDNSSSRESNFDDVPF